MRLAQPMKRKVSRHTIAAADRFKYTAANNGHLLKTNKLFFI